ncbi:hypothetical protein HanHA300_Chr00c0194g0727421 [Helianthus annuus]|nr:hypothetical protein HanIR_Chr05g0228991 [Helianthus annuus]KAJ0584432.1 hypothetical protein HanHA89_Chr05g0188541 [Helianthus annuus]KAJ0630550.1 hypothetical protein HanHA300_Chr00c0194g0727421 [Helianthus annuus]
MGTLLSSSTDYRTLVRALHPDVSFAINRILQFMHSHTTTQQSALKGLLRYLQGTISHGIFICRKYPIHLHALGQRKRHF